ncbi:MAG: ribosome silencing factor [Thermoanaerobaculia bacterium]
MTPGLSSEDKVREGLTAALDRKAAAVLVFNLIDLTTIADYFVLSTARSDRQARAIADAIAEKLGPAHSVEGMTFANWILLDYGDVVFHVFQEEARKFYALERLWGDAENETVFFSSGSTPLYESRRPL